MKKLLAGLCVLASTLSLAACDTSGSGYVDTQPPYAQERTVGTPTAPVVAPEPAKSAEPVFEKKVTK